MAASSGKKGGKSPFKFLKGLNLKKLVGKGKKSDSGGKKPRSSPQKQGPGAPQAPGPQQQGTRPPARQAPSGAGLTSARGPPAAGGDPDGTKKSLKKLISEMGDLKSKVGQIDSTLEVDKKFQQEVNEKLGKLEKEIHELFSIYEMMTSTINPFIDAAPRGVSPLPEGDMQMSPGIPGFGPSPFPPEPDGMPDIPQIEPLDSPFEGDKPQTNLTPTDLPEEITSPKEDDISMVSKPSISEPPIQTTETKEIIKKVKIVEGDREFILSEIDKQDPTSVLVALKWLEVLVERIGVVKLEELFLYYVSIGWIGNSARKTLLSYLKGIATRDKVRLKGRHSLGVKDHLFSLYVIRKLAKEEGTASLRVSILDDEYKELMEEIESIGLEGIGAEGIWA